jgi:hypothetical protein
MGNVLLGAVALAIAEGILSRSSATARVGGFVAGIGKAVEWFVSPAVPAFSSAAASTSSTALAVESAFSPSSSTPPTPSTTPAPLASGIPLNQQSAQTQAQGGVV